MTLAALDRVGARGDVVAVDASVDALERLRLDARARGANGRLSFLIGEPWILPLLDASADGVVARAPLTDAAARELLRILRPGGRVCVLGSSAAARELELAGFVGLRAEDGLVSGRTPA